MPQPRISLVASVAQDGGIGHAGDLLVRLPGDLPRFKRLTLGAPIVMGRKTWDSIGRPLPGRRNIVVTRQPGRHAEGAEQAGSLEAALALAATSGAPRVFVIGGAALYRLALPLADTLELTEIEAVYPADAYFPSWDRGAFSVEFREAHATAEGVRYAFVTYTRNAAGD